MSKFTDFLADEKLKRINVVLAVAACVAVVATGVTVAVTMTSQGGELVTTDPSTAASQITESYTETEPVQASVAVTTTLETEATSEETTTTETTTEETTTQGKLKSLDGYAPGDVISSNLIDDSNLWQYFTSSEITEGGSVYNRIYGQSYVENDNISLSDLRYLKMLHVNFNGEYQVGEMIVNKAIAEDVMEIFETLCSEGYQIEKMYLIDNYWTGDGESSDWNSIEHNNTSCFCYRPATGSSGKLSKHSYGLAIDINPQYNPYVTILDDGSYKYSHDNAADYVSNRSSDMPHVITTSDLAYQLFTSYGWTWGGSWTNPKDYQHFQISL